MRTPKRIQRKRTKGWRMPVGAIYVGRQTQWGNPYRVVREGGFMWVEPDGQHIVCSTNREENLRERHQEAVDLYRKWIATADLAELRRALGGRDLVCWCPADRACHADVLLELANDLADDCDGAVDTNMLHTSPEHSGRSLGRATSHD